MCITWLHNTLSCILFIYLLPVELLPSADLHVCWLYYHFRAVLSHFKSIAIEMDREISRATYKSLSIGMALEKSVFYLIVY